MKRQMVTESSDSDEEVEKITGREWLIVPVKESLPFRFGTESEEGSYDDGDAERDSHL